MNRETMEDDRKMNEEIGAARSFSNLAHEGEYSKAYEVFNQHPNLINWVKFGELINHYSGIKRNMGEYSADIYREALKKKIDSLWVNDLIIEAFPKKIKND
tara:strand:+ start:573 stop:875 length:303 start_codon:yes stop_codon:yes gene_type:complete